MGEARKTRCKEIGGERAQPIVLRVQPIVLRAHPIVLRVHPKDARAA
ncbi:hypothetical protein [Achromobacter pestifer]|nr:hypothetical protein [Achromobacter pestifer]